MQISLNTVQSIKLVEFLRDNLGDDGVLLTQQGQDVYASTGLAGATIYRDGNVAPS